MDKEKETFIIEILLLIKKMINELKINKGRDFSILEKELDCLKGMIKKCLNYGKRDILFERFYPLRGFILMEINEIIVEYQNKVEIDTDTLLLSLLLLDPYSLGIFDIHPDDTLVIHEKFSSMIEDIATMLYRLKE